MWNPASSRISMRYFRVAVATLLLGGAILPLTGRSQDLPAPEPEPTDSVVELPPPSQPSPVKPVMVPPLPEVSDSGDVIEPPAPGPVPSPEVPDAYSEVVPPMIPPAPADTAPSVSQPVEEEWVVEIVPLEKKKVPDLIARYDAVYKSIPYRRAEYLANPSYRHDTTVEILFGQMRPTVVNKTDTPQRVVNPRPQLTQPYPISVGELDAYWPFLLYNNYPLPMLLPIQ
ncbi:hypothetical protein SH661x_004512 [Planctomicrobium sp. SH661]|uniref:hypothetical protein n=1 Tax=Planctomicrobium sp. SH661 TaxID=3448124 RepID=UPI003F5B3367